MDRRSQARRIQNLRNSRHPGPFPRMTVSRVSQEWCDKQTKNIQSAAVLRHLGTHHNSSILVTDWLLQQMTAPSPTAISLKTRRSGSSRAHDHQHWTTEGKRHPGSTNPASWCVMLMAESGFGVSGMNP
jgi:hypothetical protein